MEEMVDITAQAQYSMIRVGFDSGDESTVKTYELVNALLIQQK